MPEGRLYVVLGGDYAGKSTALRRLGPPAGWRIVTADDDGLPPAYASLAALRRLFVRGVLPQVGQLYSPDYLLSGLQMPLVYLRDHAAAERRTADVLVDSYYYKVLAKCALVGLHGPAFFDYWRSFPRPDRVLFVRTSGEIAWRRAQLAGRLNGFEHYGPRPTRQGFLDFQRDLQAAMLDEVGALPVDFVDGDRPPAAVARSLGAALGAGPQDPADDAPAAPPRLTRPRPRGARCARARSSSARRA